MQEYFRNHCVSSQFEFSPFKKKKKKKGFLILVTWPPTSSNTFGMNLNANSEPDMLCRLMGIDW